MKSFEEGSDVTDLHFAKNILSQCGEQTVETLGENGGGFKRPK